jgi:hypothetical protein
LSGFFTLEEKSFFIIGELIHLCLDEVIMDKDYSSAKDSMNISQTLYKTATEPNKPRVFLQAYIENHPLWKSLEFWEEFIKYMINEEMHSQKNYNIYSFETQKEKLKRFKQTVSTQLVSFCYNMLSFEVNKSKVQDVIFTFCNYYELEVESIEKIKLTLEEYSSINSNKVKEELKQVKDEIDTSTTLSILKGDEYSMTITPCKVSDHIDDFDDDIDELEK